jgi:hypothetical protein
MVGGLSAYESLVASAEDAAWCVYIVDDTVYANVDCRK